MIGNFCGLCGTRRKSHEFCSADKRCNNTECRAYDIGIYFDDGMMYDMILEIGVIAKI